MLIGLYNQQIFIKNGNNYHVIRPVEKSVLEKLRTIEGLKEYGYDDYWRGSVNSGDTELGLDDFLSLWLDECFYDEDFPLKDDSFVNEVSDEEIAKANEYLLNEYGIEVGTWEFSGLFAPDGEFELILRND